MSVDNCCLIELQRITDSRGSLCIVEAGNHIPFNIERVYYLYDFAPGTRRGGHAHKALRQLFIALTGAFDLVLDDGRQRCRVRLESPHKGLLVGPMIWREIENATSGSVCLVLASARYDEGDYFRDYQTFIDFARLAVEEVS